MDIQRPNLEHEIRVRLESGPFRTKDELLLGALQALDEKLDLERLLLEGLDSGEPIEMTPEFREAEKIKLLERRARLA